MFFIIECAIGWQILFLKEFYKKYVFEFEKINANQNDIDSLIKVHCSDKFLTNLYNSDINYDPFLNAQDVTSDIFKSFKVETDINTTNAFIISYNNDYDNSQIIIKIKLVKVNDKYKIDSFYN